LRRFVYGRDDPRPGNFAPILRSTDDFERIVEEVTGQEWGWFFDGYVRSGPLPRLETARDGTTLKLKWQVEGGGAFPLPIEVAIDGQTVLMAMAGGAGSVDIGDPRAHVVIDPAGKVLRYDPAIAEWQAWTKAQQAKQAAAGN
jgi:hypothetical protein